MIPSTFPVPVVLAGASGGPVCRGTPSNPVVGCDADVVAPADVPVPPALDVPVPAELEVPVLAGPVAELELGFDEPQAARARAQTIAVTAAVSGRIGSAKVAGYEPGSVGSVYAHVR